jgi:hypothetical protein
LVIFPGVLEEILENERGVAFFARDEERLREIGLESEVEGVGHGAEIVERGRDEGREVEGRKVHAKAAGIEAREEEEVFDYAGEAVGLMDEGGDFLTLGGCEVFAGEEFFEPGAEHGDGSLELVGGVGGEAGGALEFLGGVFEGGFGAGALGEVFGGVDGEFFHGGGEARSEKMAGGEAEEEHEGAGAEDAPAELVAAHEEVGEGKRADFVGRSILGVGIEAFGEDEVRCAGE